MISHASTIVQHLADARRAAGHLLIGLDFDGTIAPIVPFPDDAAMTPAAAAAVRDLADRQDTWVAILSGRALHDTKRRVPLANGYYAGNHGLEIEGPDVHFVHPQADALRPTIAAVAADLRAPLAAIDGTEIEFKTLTLSVHYRRVDDASTEQRIHDVVEQTCAPYDGLRITHGKKVIEVRPDVAWNKGEALRVLRERLAGEAPVVFIGDDLTDEDGFRQVGPNGYGVLVADPPRATAAQVLLHSVDDVVSFLRRLHES